MTIRDGWYHLAMRAYPVEFRRTHGEEMLTTLAEMREAGKTRGRMRDLASLVFNGGRQRWLESTGGSLAATLRQGLAWAVLLLVVRQAGLAAQDVFRPLVWGYHSIDLAPILLVVGWLATFCLLAFGSRRWGLVALTATIGGFVYHRVDMALGYPGRFDLPWTLGFFIPVVLPLLAAYAWPERGAKLSARWWPVWVVSAAVVVPQSLMGIYWGQWFDGLPFQAVFMILAFLAVVLAIVVGLSDPRWLAATCMLLLAYATKYAVPVISGRSFASDTVYQLVGLWVIISVVALLIVRGVTKRAILAR